jgi:hypothetical protein
MTFWPLTCALLLLPAAAFSQTGGEPGRFTLPAGTPLPVKIAGHLPMKAGQPLRTELLYPVYVDDQLVLPARTVITGSTVSLSPDRTRRLHARLRADFTPFHTPVVRFDHILPPIGPAIPIATGTASNGAPIDRVVRTPVPKGGIVGQYFAFAVQHVKDTVQTIVGPDKADRALQFLYSQLPYHPERIAKNTAWTVETTLPVTLSPISAPPAAPEPKPTRLDKALAFTAAKPPADSNGQPTWILQAYLDDAISSETSKPNQAIRATVAEPVLNLDGSVAVPQGSVLSGSITQARPSRRFARMGVLRLKFSELKLPGQEAEAVRTTLRGTDSGDALAMDSEGDVKPKPQDKILVPALLIILASQPFDRGHHGDHDGMGGKDAEASGSLGLISLIVGTAAQQPNFAIGLGFYSSALSIYPRYFSKGAKVAFPRDTRIVVETTPQRSAAIKPATQP